MKYKLIVAGAALLVVSSFLVKWRPAEPMTTNTAQGGPQAKPLPHPDSVQIPAKAALVVPVQPEASAPAGAPVSEGVVRVTAGEILATVNGTSIELRDLMPIASTSSAAVNRTISSEQFQFLLSRAIERELVFQQAKRDGVELSPEQKQKLQAYRSEAEGKTKDAFDLQPGPEVIEFEQRDLEGLLLRATLAGKAGVPSPYVTAEKVAAYYQEHRIDYGGLPLEAAIQGQNWNRIDSEIRQKLALELLGQYERQLQAYLQRIKSNATIALNRPVS